MKKEELKREVWDCGSSLYDSFELKSLQHHLNSAISARTMSMPHLSRYHPQPPPSAPNHRHKSTSKKHSVISRSFHKLLRSVFRTKHNHHDDTFSTVDGSSDHFYVYDTSNALSTIPEVSETLPEFEGLSSEMKSLVTRTRSERFLSTSSLGISCV